MGGTKYDEGKLRMDLVSPSAFKGMVNVLTAGAKKYKARNWEEGIDYGRVYAAALRHLYSWWEGEELDPDDHLHHLDHAACCIHFLSHYVKNYYKKYDSRPSKRSVVANIEVKYAVKKPNAWSAYKCTNDDFCNGLCEGEECSIYHPYQPCKYRKENT